MYPYHITRDFFPAGASVLSLGRATATWKRSDHTLRLHLLRNGGTAKSTCSTHACSL